MALKQKKVKELDNAKKEKSQLIKEIKSERKNINDRLDKMEMELLQEMDATFQIKLKHIESNMKEVDLRIAALKESLQKINVSKHENESEKYVQVKLIKEKYKNSMESLKYFERSSKTGTLRFHSFRRETDLKCNTIGSILHLPATEVENCIGEFNIRVAGDKERCEITDMCMCDDGCIVMTDTKNKRIKNE
jgi:chromosome segregation ATPase